MSDVEYLKDTRIKEAFEMQDLNTRLSEYMDVSREKYSTTSQLIEELETLKNSIRRETTSIREMYDAEIGQLRDILDNTEREKNEYKSRMAQNETECDELRNRYPTFIYQNWQTRDFGGKKCCAKSQVRRPHPIDCSKDRKRRKETQFVGKCFSRKQELKDLRALANDDQFAQSKEWWNVEFSNCIKEIQSEYENRLESIRLEMECLYDCKVGNNLHTRSMRCSPLASKVPTYLPE
ncbi:60 kDa neurofilament protein-like [Octopus sinensis]|uniref:60 kDa neurofilament protein-like n=1 Tax=Octopus sinensis TaxID=2607531 RepID=A0A7E6ELQ6_9MOLL|nr:60 kDa neurofilament protein-like [Octopus sinensis]